MVLTTAEEKLRKTSKLRSDVAIPLVVYCLGIIVVTAGGFVGSFFVHGPEFGRPISNDRLLNHAWLDCVKQGNGVWHLSIVSHGYHYADDRMSNVAFFPLYPMLVWTTSKLTGMAKEGAVLVVSAVSGLAAFCVIWKYLKLRLASERSAWFGLLLFAFYPLTFFFRFGYSEYLFLLLSATALLGFEREWRPLFAAGAIGLATACRPVGVALLAPLAIYLWRFRREGRIGWPMFAVCALVACSGVLGYMTYLYYRFDEPLAFALAQRSWSWRPHAALTERAWALVTLEPIFTIYDPNSPAHWRQFAQGVPAVLSLQFANPIWFLLVFFVIYAGFVMRKLTSYEFLYSAVVLLIPYITRSYEMCMAGQGRFAAVALPFYVLLGNGLGRLPLGASVSVVLVFAVYMFLYTALFCAKYMLL